MGEEMPMLYSRELHLTQSTWDGGIIMLQNSSRMCSFIRYAAIALLMIAICALVALVALPGRASADVGSEEMYRVYNPNSGEHFYTAHAAEKDNLVNVGWTYEGIGWIAPAYSSAPVYRLYSGTDHHYTKDAGERDELVRLGWSDEGIGWYSSDARTDIPLYRQFNPNVNPKARRNNSGSHNYTTSKGENDSLVNLGWHGEGIGWYAIGAGQTIAPPSNSNNSSGGGSNVSSGEPSTGVSDTVYVTRTGKTYHRQNGCRSTANKNLSPISLFAAQSQGLTPCRNCFH